MSNKKNDSIYETIHDWLLAKGWKPDDGIFSNEKGEVWVYRGGRKVYMPGELSELYKELK